MTTSALHDRFKEWIGTLVALIAEECDRGWISAGSMTFRREDLERGMEPDNCYWIENVEKVACMRDWDPQRDPPPDLVMEIEVSRSLLDRMGILAALGVPEVC